jgi:hypothetical protein
MTKHASTSNCVGKDGDSGCGGVPLPLPLPSSPCLPCLLPSPCMPLLPLSSPLLLLSPWRCPHAAAATNNNSSNNGAPPQPLLPSLPPLTWGEERARCSLPLLPPLARCRRIPKEDWDHLGINGGGSPPPPSSSPPFPRNNGQCGG